MGRRTRAASLKMLLVRGVFRFLPWEDIGDNRDCWLGFWSRSFCKVSVRAYAEEKGPRGPGKEELEWNPHPSPACPWRT